MSPPARTLLAMAAGLLAMPAIADPGFRSGIYSSYFVHPETGDSLGMELELHLGAAPYGIFTLCEGECAPARRVPIKIFGNLLAFRYAEPLVDGQGRAIAPAILGFTAIRRGTGLAVRQQGSGGPAEQLRPIRTRRALARVDNRPPVQIAPSPRA